MGRTVRIGSGGSHGLVVPVEHAVFEYAPFQFEVDVRRGVAGVGMKDRDVECEVVVRLRPAAAARQACCDDQR